MEKKTIFESSAFGAKSMVYHFFKKSMLFPRYPWLSATKHSAYCARLFTFYFFNAAYQVYYTRNIEPFHFFPSCSWQRTVKIVNALTINVLNATRWELASRPRCTHARGLTNKASIETCARSNLLQHQLERCMTSH